MEPKDIWADFTAVDDRRNKAYGKKIRVCARLNFDKLPGHVQHPPDGLDALSLVHHVATPMIRSMLGPESKLDGATTYTDWEFNSPSRSGMLLGLRGMIKVDKPSAIPPDDVALKMAGIDLDAFRNIADICHADAMAMQKQVLDACEAARDAEHILVALYTHLVGKARRAARISQRMAALQAELQTEFNLLAQDLYELRGEPSDDHKELMELIESCPVYPREPGAKVTRYVGRPTAKFIASQVKRCMTATKPSLSSLLHQPRPVGASAMRDLLPLLLPDELKGLLR